MHVIIGVRVVDFFCTPENKEVSYCPQTNYRMIVGLISREISWIQGVSFRNEMTYIRR